MSKLQPASELLSKIRQTMRENARSDEGVVLKELILRAAVSADTIEQTKDIATELVDHVRKAKALGLMEAFLAEYGLSTKEGVALMCLAEALLRVPDSETIDALIEDKISPSDWGAHLGQSNSSLVNASSWALMLTGKVLKEGDGVATTLHSLLKRVGEPLIRKAVAQAMRELGHQFVLGRNIEEAMLRAQKQEKKGYTYSYDMLGEAARTYADAQKYHLAYSDAISTISRNCNNKDCRFNPGISVKLSALHPRYEATQAKRMVPELINRTLALASLAKSANMGFNIDAEEQDRLDLSLNIIETVLANPALADWDGFGVVVQAYGLRARYVVDWLYALAKRLDRRIMVRLVKGAYWDTEIKRAQVLGLDGFPVFTRKASTDMNYIACSSQLLDMTDRIFPQFATHNAHTIASVLAIAERKGVSDFEFQRLHGMGEVLHNAVIKMHETNCRVYAPVGAHEDLLAYLVRRLLENGANSSFVNQIVDKQVPVAAIVADPIEAAINFSTCANNPNIKHPNELFGETRSNAKGWDISDSKDQKFVVDSIAKPLKPRKAGSLLAGKQSLAKISETACTNPARPDQIIGQVKETLVSEVGLAVKNAVLAGAQWTDIGVVHRSKCLRKAAVLYEQNAEKLFQLASQEAGKTAVDVVAELREAVDFLYFYANEAERLAGEGQVQGRGAFVCISPWNFPLAIFTGQIAAALAVGNAVLAKPAEQTPLIAIFAVNLLHQAGVPKDVLQLLVGSGAKIGGALVSNPEIAGVCFTGSTPTAKLIDRAMATHASPCAPLIAETGGINAMIVDSSALPEQAVRDILASAFQSAGQRCSALRILYVQEDIASKLLKMLQGSMDALVIGDPADIATDVGPVIDVTAKSKIDAHIQKAKNERRLIKQISAPKDGIFVGPALIQVDGISDLQEEIFGPVLHVATFKSSELINTIEAINDRGFGLTFGLHTRIDDRVQTIVDKIKCGNIYINRNQIGAVVASQPFGGEGLSGTGPKAGGPNYLRRFVKPTSVERCLDQPKGSTLKLEDVQRAIDNIQHKEVLIQTFDLDGPTGESNRLSEFSRGVVLCLGPTAETAMQQAKEVLRLGCNSLAIAAGLRGANTLDGEIDPSDLERLSGFHVVVSWASNKQLRALRSALSRRQGPILPLIADEEFGQCVLERHVCIDTTAAGGNASLLASA